MDKHFLPNSNILATIRVQAVGKAAPPKRPVPVEQEAAVEGGEESSEAKSVAGVKGKPSHLFLRETHAEVQ
jgi:hypothetical protein